LRLSFSLDPLIAEAKRRARRRRLLLLALGVAAGGAAAIAVALQSDTGGRVVATVMPDLKKVGQSARPIPVATAPSDASGNFVFPPAPRSPFHGETPSLEGTARVGVRRSGRAGHRRPAGRSGGRFLTRLTIE
jgi:hypothetical protein